MLLKAQSAMEYLMTYGWAILIISIVLAALFQLGVFNPMTFAPKAQPGACQVFRPNGPGTTSFINLEGECTGELPQYVAQFNGASSVITASTPEVNENSGGYNTVTFWMNAENTDPVPFSISTAGYGLFLPSTTCFGFDGGGGNVYGINYQNYMNHYTFVAAEFYNGNTINDKLYINGVQLPLSFCYGSSGSGTANGAIYIGGDWAGGGGYYLNGQMANVQVYNTALSANGIQALYLEGIGGAPINLQHLVAWWPLNGNANDYSGNDNNGQINNVNFVSNWYSSYTPT